MGKKKYIRQPRRDKNDAKPEISTANFLQTRPFQPEHPPELPTSQTQAETESNGRGFDLTKLRNFSVADPSRSRGLPLQARLTIGAPGDKYEQEADRVANQVVGRLHEVSRGAGTQSESIQRESMAEEDELQMKPDTLQRESLPEEEEELQMKPVLQRRGGNGAVDAQPELEQSVQQRKGKGQPLTDTIRQPMEQAFGGVDFGGVNVHTDAQSDRLNQVLQAKAFTTGRDIFFRQGAYQPESKSGQKLIAHELTHVVQQRTTPMIQRDEGKLDPGDNLPGIDQTVAAHFKKTKKNEIDSKRQESNKAIGILRDAFFFRRVREDLSSGDYKKYFSKENKMKAELSKYEGTLSLQATHLYNRALEMGIKKRLGDLKQNASGYDFEGVFFPTLFDKNFFENHFNDDNIQINKVALNSVFHFYCQELLVEADNAHPSEKEEDANTRIANELATKFLSDRANVEMPEASLTKKEKAQFSLALRQMPTIQYLLSVHKNKGNFTAKKNDPQWKDGGDLVSKIEESATTDDGKKLNVFQKSRDWIDSGKFARHVAKSDQFIRTLVEPELLGQLNRPKIIAHLQNDKLLGGFRAFCNTGDAEVHVAQNQDIPTIVHEVMHYIEHNLPDEAWHDIHLLMRTRHAESTGKSGKNPALVGSGEWHSRGEGRYRGDYDATGKYTSSVYDDGDTEVTSMTTQFLSDPKNINKMIDKDPQQTAIILRALKPKEYAQTNALRFFDHYLPHAR